MDMLTSVSIVKKAQNQVSCNMAGESVILNMESGLYYGMDEVGSLVWRMLDEPRSVEELREAIMQEYEVDAEHCDRDLQEFLSQMQSEGVIEIQNEQAA